MTPRLVPLPARVAPTGSGPLVADGLAVTGAPADVVQVVEERLRRAGAPSGSVPVVLALEGPVPPSSMTDPGAAAASGYRLVVGPAEIRLTAAAPAGLLAGSATLAQLVADAGPDGRLPGVAIDDEPRFAWRGLCLDVARRFFPVADVAAVVEIMADLRLNVLHLHLTDDQGWRVALPSRPELTERSSGTGCGGGPGGYYTEADLAEITAHAARLGVTVIPEIDVPGHVNAALHALGELTPGGDPAPEYTGMEVGFSRLHEDLPATEPFLRDVFTDLAALTPGPWIHVGGDEPLVIEPDEYARLVTSAARHVTAAGKRVVTWQEGAVADLPEGAVVQYWDDRVAPEDVTAAVARGAHLLLSPAGRVYLDLEPEPGWPIGQDWAGQVSLRDAYAWEPLDVAPGVPADRVVGIEAAVFTETLRTRDDLTLMLLPRLAAVAEVAWTPAAARDWDDFTRRVPVLAAGWDAAGHTWHRTDLAPWPPVVSR